MNIRCIAVEDEPMAMKKLVEFINDIPYLDLLAQFENSLEALNFLLKNPVDLIFLDIQMDKLNGIQLLESLPSIPQVILTTAYNQYALKGYELQVSDYLLKPYPFDRFIQAVNKVRDKLILKGKNERSMVEPAIIFIKTAYQIERVILNEIQYIEGMKDYLGIVSQNKRYMCLQSFSSILKVLPEQDFVRVHKSYIVSLNQIESISKHRIKIGEKLIPISETYEKSFFQMIEKYRNLLS